MHFLKQFLTYVKESNWKFERAHAGSPKPGKSALGARLSRVRVLLSRDVSRLPQMESLLSG